MIFALPCCASPTNGRNTLVALVFLGTLEHWNIGTLEHWNIGTLEQWNIGTVEQWNSGTVEQWNSGTVEQWNSGTFDKFQKECHHLQQQLQGLNKNMTKVIASGIILHALSSYSPPPTVNSWLADLDRLSSGVKKKSKFY
jgi:hypothetical protein